MEYYLSLGTNIGNRCKNLKNSINKLKQYMDIICLSSIYETEPIDMQPDAGLFYNMVLKAESVLDPYKILELTQITEMEMGREKKERNKNGIFEDRLIDIDILLAGNEIIESEQFILPHKEMIHRAFVLIPLCEIEFDLYHPVHKKSISSFLESLTDKKGIVKIDCKNHSF
jgi:2-amino-4-hydroxy-6-hydroxymethyldihydropteridine diphosphokinase